MKSARQFCLRQQSVLSDKAISRCPIQIRCHFQQTQFAVVSAFATQPQYS